MWITRLSDRFLSSGVDCDEKNVAEGNRPEVSVWADEGMLRQTLFNLL